MIRNPFARKPKTPIDQAVDAFDTVRSDAADYAATIRDAAADIADTLTELGPPAPKGRKLPIIAAVAAAGLSIAYIVKSRLGASAPASPQYPPPEAPKEPEIVVSNGQPEPALEQTPAEEAREAKTPTTESEAAPKN